MSWTEKGSIYTCEKLITDVIGTITARKVEEKHYIHYIGALNETRDLRQTATKTKLMRVEVVYIKDIKEEKRKCFVKLCQK